MDDNELNEGLLAAPTRSHRRRRGARRRRETLGYVNRIFAVKPILK